MEMSSREKSEMHVRLLYVPSGRVLFMEVGKEFVDLLLSFVSLPFASIMQLLPQFSLGLGSMDKLLSSLEGLKDSTSLTPWPMPKLQHSPLAILQKQNTDTETLNCVYSCDASTCPLESVALSPFVPCPRCKRTMTKIVPLLPQDLEFYSCSQCGNNSKVSRSQVDCVQCRYRPTMNNQLTVVTNPNPFVPVTVKEYLAKDNKRFLVTNELLIIPSSAIDGFMLISKEDRGDEIGLIDIELTPKQALKLLQLSLTSKTILTDVFAKEIERQSL